MRERMAVVVEELLLITILRRVAVDLVEVEMGLRKPTDPA